jgi:AcrR family transcriptional regulator
VETAKESKMENDIELKHRILQTSCELFFKNGISRITLDDIAGKMGMSKKTLYKFFDGKDELVREVAQMQMDEMTNTCAILRKNTNIDFLDRFRAMLTNVAEQFSKMGRPLFEDLAKNNPHLWQWVSECRERNIEENFGGLLREGIEKGYFRSDINRDLLMMIYSSAIQGIINPDYLMNAPYSAAQVYEAVMSVVFEGILTDEARAKRVVPRQAAHEQKSVS